MGLVKLFRNITHLGRVDLDQSEERSGGFYDAISAMMGRFFYGDSNEVEPVNCHSAMRITTFFTCMLVRGESLSTLPVSVMQKTDNGSRVARDNPTHYLIHNKPNPFQTAADFWKSVSAHIDVFGNCFAIVSYSGNLRPKRIDLVKDPLAVQVLVSESGEAYYEYNGKKYRDYEMLHFKDLSMDGIYGCSRVHYNKETLTYAAKLRKYGSNAIGVKPPGYFTSQANFETIKKQQESLSKTWTEGIAAGKVPFLPMGLEYKNLMINPDDAQFLDSVGATKEDICGIMRVPPTMVQNYQRSTWANAEQQDLTFVKYTMLPLCTNIEQELNSKLFAESNKTSATYYYCKFNTNAFMRGDFKSRTEGYKTLWERGLISGNMVADLEDWDHFEGGDDRFVPMNMIKLSRVDEFIDNLTEPIDTNVGDQGGDSQNRSFPKVRGFKIRAEDLILNGHE
jgi:HK97 family phage portal protein